MIESNVAFTFQYKFLKKQDKKRLFFAMIKKLSAGMCSNQRGQYSINFA